MTETVVTVNESVQTVEVAGDTVTVVEEAVNVVTAGTQGPPGAGGASGGTTGQYLRKASNTDYDTEWDTITPSDVGLGSVADALQLVAANNLSDLTIVSTARTNLGLGSLAVLSAVSLTSNVTGTLPFANGGTGQTTANAALNALLPSQTGNGTKFLTTDGSNTSWAVAITSPGGSSGQIQYNSGGAFAGAAALTYAASGTHLTVTAQAATDVPLVVKAAGSHSAHLADFRNSSNTVLSFIASNGWITAGHASTSVAPITAISASGTPAGYFSASSDNALECHGSGGSARAAGYFVADNATTGAIYARAGGTSWTTPLIKLIAPSTVQARDFAAIDGAWVDSTDATRKGRLYFSAYDASGLREGLRIDADGSAARIGFFGATAVVKAANNADLRASLINYGLYTSGGATPLDLNGGALTAGSLQCDSIANDTGLASGTYTPTLTNAFNLDGSTAYACQYFRIGDRVTVAGRVDVNPTNTGTTTLLDISLPIASNFSSADQCAGVAFCPSIAGQGAAIVSEPSSDVAEMQWVSGDTTNQAMYFTFTYQVI